MKRKTNFDLVREAAEELGTISTNSVIEFVKNRYPDIKINRVTIRTYLIGCSKNHTSSHWYPYFPKFLWRISRGKYRLCDPEKDQEPTQILVEKRRKKTAQPIDDVCIKSAVEKIRMAMNMVPQGETKSLYELAKESAEEFLSCKRRDGKQDVILLDSILSIGRRYKLVTKWVGYYNKYVKMRDFQHSLETLAKLDLNDYRNYLKSTGVPCIPNVSRVESAKEFAKLFLQRYPKSPHRKSYGLFRWVKETEGWTQFLKEYSERDDLCRAFTGFMLEEYNRSLPKGRTLIGLSVFQYLRMQCGEDTLKPDRRVKTILKKLLGCSGFNETECILVASKIVKELGIRLIELDQILVSEDYLSCEQKPDTFLQIDEH